jgi:acetyltransferase-like isoleucine patch superfamily enzyme
MKKWAIIFLVSATFLRRAKNVLYNNVFSILCGKRVRLVWVDIKITGPSQICFGENFSAGRGLWLAAEGPLAQLRIGDNVNMSDWVHIGALNSVTVGNGVLLGSKVLISDHAHGVIDAHGPHDINIPPNQRPLTSKGPVVIGDNVWIGDGACVLAGVTIGAGAIIGANAVVVRNVPARTIWAGVPAKQIWPSQNSCNE